jgi:hypothetical protein
MNCLPSPLTVAQPTNVLGWNIGRSGTLTAKQYYLDHGYLKHLAEPSHVSVKSPGALFLTWKQSEDFLETKANLS